MKGKRHTSEEKIRILRLNPSRQKFSFLSVGIKPAPPVPPVRRPQSGAFPSGGGQAVNVVAATANQEMRRPHSRSQDPA